MAGPNISIPKRDAASDPPEADRLGIYSKAGTDRPDGALFVVDDQGQERQLADQDWVNDQGTTGDVVGPASATDNAVPRYDGTTGKLIQSSGVTIDDNAVVSQRAVKLATGQAAPTYAEGQVYWDDTNKCLAVQPDTADSTLQVGQELWVRIHNNTGVEIPDGKVVYVTGYTNGFPTVGLYTADTPIGADAIIGMTTGTIADGSEGFVTAFGVVRDLDTSGMTVGDPVYADPSTAGGFTTTRPSFPEYTIRIGSVLVVHATAGEIEVNVKGTAEDIVHSAFIGAVVESPRFVVTSNGSVITASVDNASGSSLTLLTSMGFVTVDTSTPLTVTLTAGTDPAPVSNAVYILESTGLLTAAADYPVAPHTPIGTVICQSAASLQTDGAMKVHQWTDHIAKEGGNGHISHLNAWIRKQHATWISGVAQTLTITPNGGSPDNVIFTTSLGSVLQLDPHAFPAFTGTPDLYVVNDSVTPYTKVTDLNELLTDALGNSMSGSRFSLVIWGVVSEDTGDCKLFVNLPTGNYNNNTGVIRDADNYAVFDIPAEYKGTGFLISELKLRHQSASGGTWTEVESVDLRGKTPSSSAGGAGGGGSDFLSSLFRVSDSTDDTKKIALDASGITTGTVRTITMPDAAVDLGRLNGMEDGADVTDAANVQANEADPIVGAVTGIVKADGAGNISAAVEDTDYQGVPSEGAFADGDKTKLDGIEASADVTDEANVVAALGGASLTAVTVAGTDKVVVQDASDSDNIKTVTAQEIADLGGGGGGLFDAYAKVADEQTSATNGGTFSSGADRIRILNTIVQDDDSIVTLSTNQVELAADRSYHIRWSAPAYGCDRHQTILHDDTTAADVERGTQEFAYGPVGSSNRSFGSCDYSPTSDTALEVRHRCQTTKSPNGLGLDSNMGTNTFAIMEIWRYAE